MDESFTILGNHKDSVRAAMLLTSVMSIASREVGEKSIKVESEGQDQSWRALSMPNLEENTNEPNAKSRFSPRFTKHSLDSGVSSVLANTERVRAVSQDAGFQDSENRNPIAVNSDISPKIYRTRSVSIDNSCTEGDVKVIVPHTQPQGDWRSSPVNNLCSSPPASPRSLSDATIQAPNTPRATKSSCTDDAQAAIVTPVGSSRSGRRITANHTKPTVAKKASQPLKTILRRKFSWKNYPELEAFLIANREEYLRHSALNYTVQQKQYNNKLTKRLLELAGEHGYVFDEEAFNFVTVRDRIRCYFKSYVQSSKKRGVIIGYAARRAGLLSEAELERSAGTAGKIVVPN